MTRLAILLLALLAANAARAADLAAGKEAFGRCRICHAVAANAPSTVGPSLHGLFGRRAGSLGDYDYSAAMKRSGVVWNDATLAKFLRDPKAFIPGNKMGFPGIDDAAAVSNLLAYLRQATE
jgi:cytochrome c